MTERKASMGDKVYRGDAVKFIRNNISLGTFMKRTIKTADEACWDLCDKLNYVPAIEEKPEPHWIPVTERLPEVGQDVMLSVHEVYSAEGCLRPDGDWWQFRWETVIPKERVTAWCELPEPFKGVTE